MYLTSASWCCSRLLILSLLSNVALCAVADGFRNWYWQGAVVANNWLYIEGGELNQANTATDIWPATNQTLAINLSKSWTTSTVESFTETTDKTDFNLTIRKPRLWYDSSKNTVYAFGGWPYRNDTDVAVWAFQPDGAGSANWQKVFQRGDGSSYNSFTRPGGSLTAASPTTFYSWGGFVASTTDPSYKALRGSQPPITGMVTFDDATSTWRNQSTNGSVRTYGEGQYIPNYGGQGVLAFIGGEFALSAAQYTYSTYAAMDSITIYDIKTQQWYQQSTTGSVPTRRDRFCSVGAGSKDNSTYEIYMYGGVSNAQGDKLDQGLVYVLSIPAFTWTRVTDLAASVPRWQHVCQVIGNRQMISIGGLEGNTTTKDSFPNGLGIFDMTRLAWTPQYDPAAAAYQRADVISNLYTPSTYKSPTWSDVALKSIFNDNGQSPVIVTSSSSGGSQETSKKVSGGVIAGAVVGAIAGLALLAFLAFMLVRYLRARRRRNAPTELPATAMTPVAELSSKHRSSELYAKDPAVELPAKVPLSELP